LHKQGILYAPDYTINSGGLICVVKDGLGADMRNILQETAKIYDMLLDVFRTSRTDDTPPYLIADRMAERRIIKARLAKKNGEETPGEPALRGKSESLAAGTPG
jgi:glutamate dehydrogenase/leucine dehydrogenase